MIPKEEIEKAVKQLSKESTAPDKDTPDWMESDIKRGILWADKWHEKNNTVRQRQIEGKIRGMINGFQKAAAICVKDGYSEFMWTYDYKIDVLQKLLNEIKEL